MRLGQETPGKVIGCFQAVPETGSDIRIDIEGALGIEAADAGKLIQGRDEKIAPALFYNLVLSLLMSLRLRRYPRVS